MKKILIYIAIIMASLPTYSTASEIQTISSIINTVERFLENETKNYSSAIEISIKEPDRHLRMPLCPESLVAFIPPGYKKLGNTSIGVRCNGIKPWSVYLNASVKNFEDLLVASEYIPRNTVINNSHIISVKKDTGLQSRGYFTDKSLVVGQIAKYGISKNAIITPTAIKKPLAVKRGQAINILATTNSLKVLVKGIALMDGALHDVISAKNIKSLKIVHGTVIGNGILAVQI